MFAGLIAAPLLLAGLIVCVLYIVAEQRALHDKALSTVRDAVSVIDQEIRKDVLALQILSMPLSEDQGNIERVYGEAKKLSEAMAGSIISLRRPTGDNVFNTFFPLGAVRDNRTNEVLRLAEADAAGRQTFAISDLFFGNRIRKPFVAIVQPIISDKQLIFFLDFGIPAEVISDLIRSQLGDRQWLIGVTGKDNRILARNWDSERYVGEKASDAFIENTQGDKGAFRANTLDGVSVYNVYARSKLTGWTVGAGVPLSVFEAPLYRSIAALAVITAIAAFCSLGLSYAYGRVMLRPAQELRKIANTPPDASELPAKTGVREFDDVLALLANSLTNLADRDRQLQTLVNELNHRAKNTLTTMQAIANQTYRRSETWQDFRSNFEHRLSAMACSFDLLTRNNWRASDLKELVIECCKPFCEDHRIHLAGPPVMLPPGAVVGIGMVIHELATNATKYGAFSDTTGLVDVKWEVQTGGISRAVYFEWKEHGGPDVRETLARGFGSSLIASTVERELHGKCETKLEPDGLYFCMSFPIET